MIRIGKDYPTRLINYPRDGDTIAFKIRGYDYELYQKWISECMVEDIMPFGHIKIGEQFKLHNEAFKKETTTIGVSLNGSSNKEATKEISKTKKVIVETIDFEKLGWLKIDHIIVWWDEEKIRDEKNNPMPCNSLENKKKLWGTAQEVIKDLLKWAAEDIYGHTANEEILKNLNGSANTQNITEELTTQN